MAVFFSPIVNDAPYTVNGAPASGYKLFTYTAGTTTKQTTYTTSAGNVANSNPIILNSAGYAPNEIWLTSGVTYKFVLAPSNDSDPPVSPVWTRDNISAINDISTTISEWIAGNAPTFISTTSFTLAGDATSIYTKGLRLKFTVTAGTVYGTILTSVFTTLTTITLEMDSGQVLDSGLSAVSYSILNSVHPSIPPYLETMPIVVDHTDPTKRIKIIPTGITTATTRSLTVQDQNGTIALLSDFAFAGFPSTAGRLLLPNDYITGFTLTNNGTTGFDVAAGQAMDSTNVSNIIGAAIVNKTQGAWVVGTGNGGKLSAAAMANNTWYYWFALWKTTDGTVDYGFDVATTPTLPTGYSKYRYIAARKTLLAATTWDVFIQHGDQVNWSTPPALDLNGTTTTANRTLTTMNVPAVKVEWLGNGGAALPNSGVSNGMILTDPACADVVPALTASPLFSLGGISGANAGQVNAQMRCWTNTSSQIGVRANSANTYYIQTTGWVDPRGRPV